MYSGNDGDRYGQGKWFNYDHGMPCQNKSCKSYGRPHPNCRCTASMLGMTPEWYAPQGTAAYERAHEARNIGAVAIAQRQAIRNAAGPKQDGISGVSRASGPAAPLSPGVMDEFRAGMNSRRMMAEGGAVLPFCSMTRKHHPNCEYFAEGGEADQPGIQMLAPDDPESTIGHAAITHGLLGLMDDVGDSSIQDPESHSHIIEDAKTQHSERMNPMGEEFKKTLGNRLGNAAADQDHESMADLMSGHPLVGSPGKGNLEAIFERLSQPMLAQPADPKAFRGAADYLQSSARGGARLDDLMGSLIGEKGERVKPDLKAREAMHERVKEAQADTESLLESGGDLGHYLPGHAAHLGATIARGMDYLQSLNPRSTQKAPLDEPMKPDVLAQAKYDRALDLANQPMIALTRVKDGTLIPLDVQTVQTLYPALYRSMSQKMVERVITAKAKKEFIPYKQKQAMSLFLGPPLDFTLTQAASQAIIRSSAGQQAQKQAQAQKASGPELEQVNKTAELYALPTERREMDRKS